MQTVRPLAMAFYQAREGTLKIPMTLYAKNRQILVESLKQVEGCPENGFVFLMGGKQEQRHDTDHENLFRQESYFHWLFGMEEPDCFGAVSIATGEACLFVPRLGIEYAIVMGRILTCADFQAKYEVNHVHYVDEIVSFLSSKSAGQPLLLVNYGQNTDSANFCAEVKFEGIEACSINNTLLFPVISNCRVFKTPEEIAVLRYAAEVSSKAHIEVMKAVKIGMSEFQLESLFLHSCYFDGGCRHASYTCICASGNNSAVLHYGHAGAPNSRVIKNGDLCLFDMGTEYSCYGSDITCTFPANGKFSEKQTIVYNAVLDAAQAVIAAICPGIVWVDMHLLAERIICSALLKNGLLRGDVDALIAARVTALFMPHGLGHFLGIDTHDVGGYPEGVSRPVPAGLRKLRTARVLKANMYLTVEPGLYFISALLEPAFSNPEFAPFLVKEKIVEYIGLGGVRIEEDVLVTEHGCEVLSVVPRTIAEIEAVMAHK